jgi:hypothetical protein
VAIAPGPVSDAVRWASSPLRLERWRDYLGRLGLTAEFLDVLDGIEHGFSLNASLSIEKTTVYPNHRSALDHPEVIDKIIEKELAAGRYHGPYSREELEEALGRPFVSHPLGLVTKSNGGFRLVEDLSFPRNGPHPSVNEMTDITDVPVEWGGMLEAIGLVVTAEEGAQGAVFDWGEAFRNIAVKERDHWMYVIGWRELEGEKEKEIFLRDGASKFGHSRSTGNFDRVNAAFIRILMIELILAILRWVDDLLMRRQLIKNSNPPAYNCDINDILLIADDLGISLPTNKISDFSFQSKYIGFIWHWDTKEVFVPEPKRVVVLASVTKFRDGSSISLEDLRSLCGRLSHLSLVIMEGRVHMRGLWQMLAAMEKRMMHARAKWDWWESAWRDVDWWTTELSSEARGMKLCTERTADDSFRVFVDASTSFGIGVVIGKQYERFKLADGWRWGDDEARDIGWAEFAAVLLAVFFLISTFGIRNRHILIHSDNQGVVFAWEKRWSRSPAQNRVLGNILHLLSRHQCYMTLEYVKSADNPADKPSRNLDLPGYERSTFKGFPDSLKKLINRC